MASKTSRRARNAAKRKKDQGPLAPKDDGTRWIVVDSTDYPVYLGEGVAKHEAERLSLGLVQATTLRQVA